MGSDALSISSCFQSLLGCLRLSLTSLTFFALNSGDCVYLLSSNSFCLLSLISFSFSLSVERFSCSYSFCFFSLISFSISLSTERFSCSYSFCFFSLISFSILLSPERCCLLNSLTCSFLCSAVLGVLCKKGNFFLMPSIKSVGNFLILLVK